MLPNRSIGSSSARLAGGNYTHVRILHPPGSSSVLNKTGRLVLYGQCEDRKEKIYEAANPEHAVFIRAISSHPNLKAHLPEVLSVDGPFLKVVWAHDTATRDVSPETLAGLADKIHRTPASELPLPNFDYWGDLLAPRFARAAELFGISRLAGSILSRVGMAWTKGAQYLQHPDLTPRNVVLDRSATWQIIDNELMTVGRIPFFDICNATYSLGAELGSRCARQYKSLTGIELSQQDVAILNDCWFARQLGSQFLAGDFSGAEALLRRYQRGDVVLPKGIV